MKKLLLPLALTVLCGCFQVEDELAIEPQGSGKVTITVIANLPEEMADVGDMAGNEMGGGAYPPMSESAARRLFPAKNFDVKVDRKENGSTNVLTIEASFKDIKALLASPYAEAHQLHLQTNNGVLVLRAISGMSTVAQAAFVNDDDTVGFMPVDASELKAERTKMRFSFRVRMPGAVSQANGEKNGNAVTWTASRAEMQTDEEFTRKLATTMEASCPAQSIQFDPHSPLRLGLWKFQELQEQKVSAATAAPNPEKVIAAAKIVPYRIRVTRSLDLSGEGGFSGSNSELQFGVVLPEEFAPLSWGKLKLEEVLDGSGKSLMPKEEETMMFGMRSYSSFSSMGEEDEEGEESKTKGPAPRILTASFRAPEWKVKRVNRVKGHVDLSYKGDTQVIKLTNAVPATLIRKGTSSSFDFGGSDERGAIQHAKLTELGMTLRVMMAMEQSGFVQIMMSAGGENASVLKAQVFDADGTPVASNMTGGEFGSSEEGDRSFGLMVTGKPKPPLSLALEVGAPGGTVSLPVLFENIPLSAQ